VELSGVFDVIGLELLNAATVDGTGLDMASGDQVFEPVAGVGRYLVIDGGHGVPSVVLIPPPSR
jgi:hypothetical protein